MAKKKKASTKGREPFKRKVTTITKDLVKEQTVADLNKEILQHSEDKEEFVQVDLEDMIEEVEAITIERGILNHNWVSREHGVSVEEAKEMVRKANA